MVCCIAALPTPSSRAMTAKAGKIVSIENGPNIASAPRRKASRRREMPRCSIMGRFYQRRVIDPRFAGPRRLVLEPRDHLAGLVLDGDHDHSVRQVRRRRDALEGIAYLTHHPAPAAVHVGL